MLELRRARLVNWHYFDDVTIPFGATTLLAGDNGSGKSTIIDAIQYALVARISRIRFNAAATDRRAARTLESYCRCKVGADSLEFVRGDCISHIVLEFGEHERTFCAGIMVEAFIEGEAREHPWVFEDAVIEDITIFDGAAFLDPRRFRDRLKQAGATLCVTKRDYNTRLTHLLGVHRRGTEHNPYLEALVRSVSFTPFTSVHEFVCNYILEDHPVDVTAMKENLENYRLAEGEALAVEQKVERLQVIAAASDAVLQVSRQILNQEYLRLRLRLESSRSAQEHLTREGETAAGELERAEDLRRAESERKARLDAQRQELTFALAEDESYRRFERLRRDRADTEQRLAHERERSRRLAEGRDRAQALLGRPLAASLGDEERALDAAVRAATEQSVATQREIASAEQTRAELYEERSELRAGRLRYPEGTVRLREEFGRIGIEARVFAELLDLEAEEWHDAVEGWLDARRFDLLVAPSDFSAALACYRALKESVAGVGLPNLAEIGAGDALPGSLAEVVSASTPAARHYAGHLLGTVVRSEPDELTTFERAVTRECMAYDGHVARRIPREICGRWYLGSAARERRLHEVEAEIGTLTQRIGELAAAKAQADGEADTIHRVLRLIPTIRELGDADERAERLNMELGELGRLMAAVDTSSSDALRRQIGAISNTIAEVEQSITSLAQRIGALSERIATIRQGAEQATEEVRERTAALEAFLAEHREDEAELRRYYDQRVPDDRSNAFSYEDFFRRYDAAFQGLATRRETARTHLRKLKQQYNHDFATLLELEADAADEYRTLLARYSETELPAYRERISRARSEAERQFREHFVARLNEHLIGADESFKEINSILREITFGDDQYSFSIARKPERRALLNAIAGAAAIREDEGTLFEVIHDEEERRSIEHLFAQVLEHDPSDPEMRDLCDYRRYFTYDIRIRHLDQIDVETGKPLESLLSRVLREKSGGETQTPYYVAIAAGFFRFYKDTPGAIRLVLFDEAFNKMDDLRIGRMVGFFSKLAMQVVTAVPTEKLESIAPYMERTNLVLRHNRTAFVRAYRSEHPTEPREGVAVPAQ